MSEQKITFKVSVNGGDPQTMDVEPGASDPGFLMGRNRAAFVRWGCCGLTEDVTNQRYIYPGRHMATCKGRQQPNE